MAGGHENRIQTPAARLMEQIPQEQPFDPKQIIKQIDKMAPELAVLAWENFLKRIGARVPENQAREMLLEELRNFSGKRTGSKDVLWGVPETSVEKLKKYLNGEYHISDIRTYEELAGGNK